MSIFTHFSHLKVYNISRALNAFYFRGQKGYTKEDKRQAREELANDIHEYLEAHPKARRREIFSHFMSAEDYPVYRLRRRIRYIICGCIVLVIAIGITCKIVDRLTQEAYDNTPIYYQYYNHETPE